MKINRSIIALAISSLLIISCKENKEKDNMNEDSMEMNDSSDMSEGNEMSSDDEMQDDVEIEEDITENGNEMNLSQVAMNAKDLSTFVAALQKAGMVVKIEGEGPYTIFAPTNEAFNKLPKGTVESLMEPSNTEKLVNKKYNKVNLVRQFFARFFIHTPPYTLLTFEKEPRHHIPPK